MQSTLSLEAGPAILSVMGKDEQSPLDAMNLEGMERRAAELDLVKQFTGARAVFALSQTHGALAVRIDSSTFPGPPFPEADALYSSMSGVCLVVRTADCMPLFFTASRLGSPGEAVSGIIHAGWRGLAAGIITRTLRSVIQEIGDSGEETLVNLFTGPCISGENYEVGTDVAARFEIVSMAAGKPHVDLTENAMLAVERIAREYPRVRFNFQRDFAACTVKENHRYYSHRKGDTGRNLNLLYIR